MSGGVHQLPRHVHAAAALRVSLPDSMAATIGDHLAGSLEDFFPRALKQLDDERSWGGAPAWPPISPCFAGRTLRPWIS